MLVRVEAECNGSALSRRGPLLSDRILTHEGVSQLRAQLDEATFAVGWAEGQAMTLEQAITYALEEAN